MGGLGPRGLTKLISSGNLVTDVLSKHSSTLPQFQMLQTIFAFYRFPVSLLLEKGVYSDNLCMFCVVLLQSVFFLTSCVSGSCFRMLDLLCLDLVSECKTCVHVWTLFQNARLVMCLDRFRMLALGMSQSTLFQILKKKPFF